MAIGLNIVAGFAGLLDLGYVAFYAFGAYTAAFLASPHFGSMSIVLFSNTVAGFPGIHLPFWILVPIGMLVAATFGALLGAPTLRLRGDYLAIVTLGFGEIVPVVFKNLSAVTFDFGPIHPREREPDRRQPRHQPDRPARSSSGSSSASSSGIAAVYLGMILLAGAIIIARNLEHSRMGRAWMAIREDEVAAEMMGVNHGPDEAPGLRPGGQLRRRRRRLPELVPRRLTTSDFFQFSTSILVLIMVILGGIGNIWGVIAGAITLVFVDKTFLPYLGQRIGRGQLGPAEPVAVQLPDLRPAPRDHDAVPARGLHPEPPARGRAAPCAARPGDRLGGDMGDEAVAAEEVADTIAATQEEEVLAEAAEAEAEAAAEPPAEPPHREGGGP